MFCSQASRDIHWEEDKCPCLEVWALLVDWWYLLGLSHGSPFLLHPGLHFSLLLSLHSQQRKGSSHPESFTSLHQAGTCIVGNQRVPTLWGSQSSMGERQLTIHRWLLNCVWWMWWGGWSRPEENTLEDCAKFSNQWDGDGEQWVRMRQVGRVLSLWTEMGRVNEWFRECVSRQHRPSWSSCCFHVNILQDLRTPLAPATAGLVS